MTPIDIVSLWSEPLREALRMANFEIYDGDRWVAAVSGGRQDALKRILEYAQGCERPVIYETMRRQVAP